MKSKKLRQLFALALASALCLTACGNKEETPSSESSKPSSSVAASEEKEPEVKYYWDLLDEVSDTSELPDWTGEKLEINVWVAGGTDYSLGTISDTNVVFKEIERVTGVVINADESFGNGGDNIDAKLPKLIASKDFPTLVFGWDINKQLKDLWDNGYLADLTEYYENGTLDHLLHWAPLEEMDILYSSCRDEDGAYYKIPASGLTKYYQMTGYVPEEVDLVYNNTYGSIPYSKGNQMWYNIMYVRDDILTALYPDAPTWDELVEIYTETGTFTEEQIFDLGLKSADDVIDLLYDIQDLLAKESFVGLDGKPVEVTFGPDTESDNWSWLKNFPSLVGLFPNVDYFTVAEKGEGGKLEIKRSIDSEPYIEWFKTLNTLIKDDIIEKDSLVDNKATFTEKLQNGRYAFLYGTNGHDKVEGCEEWKYRPIWVDADLTNYYYTFDGMPTPYSWSVFKDAVPEGQMDQLMHFIDYCNSKVGILNKFWGPESAGLFTVDADGNRSYVDKELEDAMINSVDSMLPYNYGLENGNMTESSYSLLPTLGSGWYNPSYLAAGNRVANSADAIRYYNPGILPGGSYGDNSTKVVKDNQIYGLGMSLEGISQFWGGRAGFENQLKKVIVAETEKEFETQLEVLRQYTIDNGFTDDVLKEYEDLFIETNYDLLKDAGLVD